MTTVRMPLVPQRYRSVLSSSAFRNFLAGSTVAGVGSSMVQVAAAWLALELAPRGLEGLAIGLTLGGYVVPGMVVGLALGGHARRLGPRKLLLLDAFNRIAFLGAVPILSTLRLLNLIVLVVLLAAASLFRSLGSAGYRSIAPDLVGPEDRLAANSLLWGLGDMGTILGPALGGVLTAAVGPAAAVGLSVPPFALFTIMVLSLRLPRLARDHLEGQRQRSSLRTLASYPRLAGLLALTFAFFVASAPLEVALPVYVNRDLGAGPEVLGFLWSAFGAGLVVGTILVGAVSRLRPARALVSIVLGWGVAMVALGLTAQAYLAVVLLFVAGLIFSPYDPIAITVVQGQARPEDLATVNAAWVSLLLASNPAGLILAGPLVDALGARRAILLSGVVTAVVGAAAGLLLFSRGPKNLEAQPSSATEAMNANPKEEGGQG